MFTGRASAALNGVGACVAWILASSCSAGGSEASAPRSSATVVLSTVPPGAVSATSPPVDDLLTGPPPLPPPRQRPPLPPVPDGVPAEQFEVVASLCAAAVSRHDGRTFFGCRSTPPFDDPGELPDGKVLEVDFVYDVCAVEALFLGSFSGSGEDEALLALASCGTDRLNDITPGHAVLASRGADGWDVEAVERDINVGRCHPRPGASGALLVCSDGIGAFSDGALHWRFTLDFSKPAGSRRTIFARIYHTPAMSCVNGVEMFRDRPLTLVDFVKEDWRDADADGDDDLVLTVARASVPQSDALVRKAQASCIQQKQRGKTTPDLDALAGPKKRHVLTFKRESAGMVPTPATQTLLDSWAQGSPQFWLEVAGK